MDAARAQKDLYREVVRAHARAPRGAGGLACANVRAEAYNAHCGDRVAVSVAFDDARIGAIGHVTDGCILCVASASLLATHAVGRDRTGALALANAVRDLVQGVDVDDLPGDLRALGGVAAFPSRRACVLLPWDALARALAASPVS